MSRFLFPRWSNLLLPTIILAAATIPVYAIFFVAYGFSPKTLEVGYQPEQPVPFSHALHAGELVADLQRFLLSQERLFTREDLAAYRAIEREPLVGTYRGHTVYTPPPASGGARARATWHMRAQAAPRAEAAANGRAP